MELVVSSWPNTSLEGDLSDTDVAALVKMGSSDTVKPIIFHVMQYPIKTATAQYWGPFVWGYFGDANSMYAIRFNTHSKIWYCKKLFAV